MFGWFFGLIASFAGWFLAMWKLKRYLQMGYALYRIVLGIIGIQAIVSLTYGYAKRRIA